MPEAMAVVWNLMRSNLGMSVKIATLLNFDDVLGLDLKELYSGEIIEEKIPEEILKLTEERKRAREEKNWAESDRLREEIRKKGYVVEDLEKSYKIKRA